MLIEIGALVGQIALICFFALRIMDVLDDNDFWSGGT